jgi:hypothetical protein
MAAETARERQRRLRENMRGLGFRRVERWERADGTDSREFGLAGKLVLNQALMVVLQGVEDHKLSLEDFQLASGLWRPLLGKEEE